MNPQAIKVLYTYLISCIKFELNVFSPNNISVNKTKNTTSKSLESKHSGIADKRV